MLKALLTMHFSRLSSSKIVFLFRFSPNPWLFAGIETRQIERGTLAKLVDSY